MKLKIKFSRHFGFTLVELLVVVAISGILASVSYIGIQEVRKTIRDNKRRADLNEVARALELFKADYGQYPPNNYSSATSDGDRDFMPFLKDGGSMTFLYPGGRQTKTIAGGYLNELKKDPINFVDNTYLGYMYAYYGSNWVSYLEEGWVIDQDFPLECPGGGSTCDDWDDCCNNGGCYDPWCDYENGEITFSTYSMNGWSAMCYGSGTSRAVSVLVARLEKESKSEEKFDDVFSFCPTADPSHPEHESGYVHLRNFFPRSKTCYNGGGQYEYDCDDEGWSSWPLTEYNYFIPLTGEFNLR